MKNEIKKTSSKWYQEQYDYILLDPDGWDRKNFDFSFNKELITLEEFNRRLMSSTCEQFRQGGKSKLRE